MIFDKQLTVLFSPYWNKSKRNRMQLSSILLLNIGLQAVTYMASLPKKDQAAESAWDPYVPIVVPMITFTAQTLMFMKLQCDIAAELQKSMVQRIYAGKHIGLVQILANDEIAKELENLSTHIDGAAQFCYLGGTLINAVPLTFYWHAAYLSLPEARPLLYTTTGIIGLIAIILKYLDSGFINANEAMQTPDIDWHCRMSQNLRHHDAVIAGSYQDYEAKALNTLITNKNAAMLKFSAYLGTLIVINGIIGLALNNLLRAAVGSFYPHLKGSSGLDSFTLEMNLFTSALLGIFSAFTQNYARSMVGLEKLYSIDQLIKELDALTEDPFLHIEYGQQLSNPNDIMQFKNFTLAIPRSEQIKQTSIRHKIETVLASDGPNFVFHAENFAFAAGELRRIYGASGIGKSTLFKAILGIWPYASGTLRFGCNENEIYAMPQEQMFVKGTLLQNVFYPMTVPDKFKDSAQEAHLHTTMRLIGLDQEIARLEEEKDWSSPDLSPGLKKRFNFLRMYMKITSGQNPNPKVILLDEMTSGVDGDNAGFLEGLVRKLRRDYPQALVLFIKHNEEQHPQQFCAEQREFVQADPDFAIGLSNCENVNLTRNCRKYPAAAIPANDVQLNAMTPTFLSSFKMFMQKFTTNTAKVADVDVEQGTELTASLLGT